LEGQVALTLRALGGLDTAEIAGAFLVSEETMKRRLSRAKAKIKATGIPRPSRSPATWPARGRSTRFGPDANGGRRARFSATAQISRGEFGIDRWNRGGVVIGDKVSIGLEIEAVRQT
jgi:polyisoprenoid-binding protein YceI